MGVFCRLPMRAFPKCSVCRVGAGWVALGNVWWGSRCYLYKIKKKSYFCAFFVILLNEFFLLCARYTLDIRFMVFGGLYRTYR